MPLAAGPLPRAAQNTFRDARTANEILKAQERRLRLDERKGKVVENARILLLLHRFAKAEWDTILGWPTRDAPQPATELGVDAHQFSAAEGVALIQRQPAMA
jgi:hypothetical protein